MSTTYVLISADQPIHISGCILIDDFIVSKHPGNNINRAENREFVCLP